MHTAPVTRTSAPAGAATLTVDLKATTGATASIVRDILVYFTCFIL